MAETAEELTSEKRNRILGRKVTAVIGEEEAKTLSPHDWDVLDDLLGWVPDEEGVNHYDPSYPDASDPHRVKAAVRRMKNMKLVKRAISTSPRDLRLMHATHRHGSEHAGQLAIALQEVIAALGSAKPNEDGSMTVTFGPAFLSMLQESMEP
jgi:hypothetical protein